MPSSTGAVTLGGLTVAGAASGGGFSQAFITEVFPPQVSGTSLHLSWTSSAPDGTFYQVYLDNHLAWWGTSTHANIPYPLDLSLITIGTVGPGQEQIDFSSMLPPLPQNRVEIQWEGGTFESPTIAGFHIYGSPAAGAAVDYAKIVATIAAYPGGVILDGYGLGKWGDGGWGEAGSYYNWTSGPLISGLWTFGVKAYDVAGNESVTNEITELIEVPPLPPAYSPGTLSCLGYTYSSSTFAATLTWLSTPG